MTPSCETTAMIQLDARELPMPIPRPTRIDEDLRREVPRGALGARFDQAVRIMSSNRFEKGSSVCTVQSQPRTNGEHGGRRRKHEQIVQVQAVTAADVATQAMTNINRSASQVGRRRGGQHEQQRERQ